MIRYITLFLILVAAVPAFSKTDTHKKNLTPVGVKAWSVEGDASKTYDEFTDKIFDEKASTLLGQESSYCDENGISMKGWFAILTTKIADEERTVVSEYIAISVFRGVWQSNSGTMLIRFDKNKPIEVAVECISEQDNEYAVIRLNPDDNRKIIDMCKKASKLILRVDGNDPNCVMTVDLTDFGKAYEAYIKNVPTK